MHISSNFDSGNILVKRLDSPTHIELEIRKDTNSDFYQWFHFRLQSTAGVAHQLRITNIDGAAYPEGWVNYQAVASYDREDWFRVPTRIENGHLLIEHTPDFDAVFYAYFAPYSWERHLDLIHSAQISPLCKLSIIGHSIEGRELHKLTIGTPAEGKRQLWVTARQHPGETMAEWFVEGFVERLLDPDDALARKLLEKAVFHIVPNMNPDGSVLGNLRTNAAGRNLNREWQNPSIEHAPEVYYTLKHMHEVGVDMLIDAHGDEGLPVNFVAACEGIPSYNARMADLEASFKQAFLAATPDFQTERGYVVDAPGEANLTMASNHVAEAFNCLALTLEMPFKDNELLPDALYGWSPARCKNFAQSIFHPIAAVIDKLR